MNEVVVVTGASSGIGKVTADLLHEKGYKIYGTSRTWSEKPVEKETSYYQIKMDVNDDQSVKKCIETILEKEQTIDVLVNNAGYGYVSSLMFGTVEDAKNQFETNFFGAVRVIEQIIPGMIKQKNGKIITIGSIGGRIAIPYQGLYSASKSALATYSDALRIECKKYNIQVSLIEPGDTSTSFDTRRIVVEENLSEPIREEMIRALNIMRKAEHNGMDPKKVAKLVQKIITKKKTKIRYTTGLDSKLVNYGTRILPKGLVERFLCMNYKISSKKLTVEKK